MGKYIFMFIVSFSLLHGQSDSLKELLNYYPLQIGNYWEYEMTSQQIPFPAEVYTFSDEVIGDTLLENNINYKILLHKDLYPQYYVSYKFERIDSLTGCVYQYRNDTQLINNEFKMDSLFSQAGDTIFSSRNGYSSFGYFRTICQSTGTDSLFGVTTQTKTFFDQSFMPGGEYKLAKGFGFYQSSGCESSCGGTSLVYAKINGIEYGHQLKTNVEKYLDSLKCYYPLETGDKWIFDRYDQSSVETMNCLWSLEVIKDTLMPNGKTYKVIVNSLYTTPKYITTSYERIDSSKAKVFRYDQAADSLDYENLILDFSMKKGDIVHTPFWEITFKDENEITYFDKTTHTREYSHLHGFANYGDQYLKNIGLYKYMFAGDFFESISFLKGCVVNNTKHGDTTITSISNDVKERLSFNLSQNYPNPFNPVTKIKYSISQHGHVSIIVYDILGKGVLTLIDQYNNAGDYEIEFNAGNLPSGVYFYKMKCYDYSKTRQLLLLK